MNNNVILKLAKVNPRMSDIDRLVNIYHMLSQVLVFDVPGSIVELGCNEGKTSIFLRMIIDYFAPHRELHLYDSFQGLPQRGKYDEHTNERDFQVTKQVFEENSRKWGLKLSYDQYLNEGDFKVGMQQLEENFKAWGLKLPFVHGGWFKDTLPRFLPTSIAFAYLDSDLYESILVSLRSIYPRLSKNAIVVIDDYCDAERNPRAWPGLPGVKRACDDFFTEKPEKISVLVGSWDLAMGYFR